MVQWTLTNPNSLGPRPIQISESFGLVHFEWGATRFLFSAHQNMHEYH